MCYLKKTQCKYTCFGLNLQFFPYFCSQTPLILKNKYLKIGLLCILTYLGIIACQNKRSEMIVAPFGEINDTVDASDNFDLNDIITNGELIMLTISGPENYYDYHGKELGAQYMLVQRFANTMGVRVRVDVCRDTVEMLRRIVAGDADIIALQLPKQIKGWSVDSIAQLTYCGAKDLNKSTGWVVSREKPQLAKALNDWYRPQMLAEVRKEETFLLSVRSVKRRVFAPMLNRSTGVISRYDALFMSYSQPIRWDWRLMAAQCYQESTFDPQAISWAGAQGLMQIMPATADHLGLPRTRLFDPEANIAAAAKYLDELDRKMSDVSDRYERMNFVLACYNGGYHHIRDAMALTRKYGGNVQRWNEVARYVLLLGSSEYYRDPVVKYGYMRGQETVEYVRRIRERWMSYRGIHSPHLSNFNMTPRRAKHVRKKKYQ